MFTVPIVSCLLFVICSLLLVVISKESFLGKIIVIRGEQNSWSNVLDKDFAARFISINKEFNINVCCTVCPLFHPPFCLANCCCLLELLAVTPVAIIGITIGIETNRMAAF